MRWPSRVKFSFLHRRRIKFFGIVRVNNCIGFARYVLCTVQPITSVMMFHRVSLCSMVSQTWHRNQYLWMLPTSVLQYSSWVHWPCNARGKRVLRTQDVHGMSALWSCHFSKWQPYHANMSFFNRLASPCWFYRNFFQIKSVVSWIMVIFHWNRRAEFCPPVINFSEAYYLCRRPWHEFVWNYCVIYCVVHSSEEGHRHKCLDLCLFALQELLSWVLWMFDFVEPVISWYIFRVWKLSLVCAISLYPETASSVFWKGKHHFEIFQLSDFNTIIETIL